MKEDNKEFHVDVRIKNADWIYDLKEAAMNTIGRKVQEGKELTPELFRKYLISEHSPIRGVDIRILIYNILATTSVHFARHIHTVPYVTSNRPDRCGKERTIEDEVNHFADTNCQGLIDMMRKRLCPGKCAVDTYKKALAIKKYLMESEDPYLRVLGEVLVPNCVYRGACPEFSNCGMEDITQVNEAVSIKEKYRHYNEFIVGGN